MSGRDYSSGVRAALIHLCQGKCYAPDCSAEVILPKRGQYVLNLEIAHIRAIEPNGPRHDSDFEDPNDFSNLLLLCKPDHKLIDQIEPAKYPVALLLEWKARRETEGAAALHGLRGLTEDRLQEMISEAYEATTQKLDDALARFAEIDSEAAELLRVLRNELVDGLPAGTLLNVETATMISSAAHILRELPDAASLLVEASNSLRGLPETAESLADAAEDLKGLPDVAKALENVVNDMKRHGQNY